MSAERQIGSQEWEKRLSCVDCKVITLETGFTLWTFPGVPGPAPWSVQSWTSKRTRLLSRPDSRSNGSSSRKKSNDLSEYTGIQEEALGLDV